MLYKKKKKTRPLSPPPGLVDDHVPSPDEGDGAMQWSAWDVGRAASKPRLAAPQGTHRAAWEAPPKGRRQLLQDLCRNLDMILRLSGHRRSHARARACHWRRTAHLRHNKWPQRVWTVPGPLPTVSASSLGPDQGGGPCQVGCRWQGTQGHQPCGPGQTCGMRQPQPGNRRC